ncbi:hypothetical protein CVD28_18815 [Bacillus sp. M6-12]|nr:hypothetical protein CVD28_18815 [Bacillus sp. M6-12]
MQAPPYVLQFLIIFYYRILKEFGQLSGHHNQRAIWYLTGYIVPEGHKIEKILPGAPAREEINCSAKGSYCYSSMDLIRTGRFSKVKPNFK